MILQSARALQSQLNLTVALIVVIGALANRANLASAALLVYEPFDYDAGTVLDETTPTGQNLTGEYMAPVQSPPFQLVVESPGIDYGSLSRVPNAAGNRLSQTSGTTAGGATVGVDQDVVINSGEAIYFSTLFTFDDSQNGNHRVHVKFTDDETGDELSFGEPTVGIRGVRIEANTAATGELVADGADGSFTDGQTLLLLGRYINSATAGGDSLELVGYNTGDADVLPASFDPIDPNAEFSYALADLDIDLAKISSITFTIRASANNFIDELRIGSTYASVVIPEPATAVLLVVGLWLAAARDVVRWQHRRGVGTGFARWVAKP